MTFVLPSATTTIVPQGAGIATGIELATIWGCVPQNADMTPRLWYDGDAFESFHGPGQTLDQLTVFIANTLKPALVVPLPISTPGIISWQKQAGSGTCTATMGVGSDGSLEHVDGALRVVRGGTIGTDQIQLEYSLDSGNSWRLFRLGTATSYTIPRTGQAISFSPGTLVAEEEILYWTSTAPTPADADIATAKDALAAQGEQSRAWYLIRDMEQEQDISAYKLAVDSYDTVDKRPLQAYAALRRAKERHGYAAQLSQIRTYMQGDPQVDFDEGPPGTATRQSGDFLTDGFVSGDFAHITDTDDNDVDGALIDTAASTVLTFNVSHTAVNETNTEPTIFAAPGLEFVDGGGSDDTLVRNRGSWTAEGFKVGQTFTVTGTLSNDGDYPITGVTATTITVATGSFTAEAISSWGVAIVVSVVYPVDVAAMDAEFATITGDEKLEISYGRIWYPSPANGGMRLRYSVALHDLCRTFAPDRDLSETTWEKGAGRLQNWGVIDANGIPFEYDERIHRAALASEFTCARTWSSAGLVPYIARSLTRYGGSDALTQSEKARVTQLGRTIVQQSTENITGSVFVKLPPNELGQQFLAPSAIGVIESKINTELRRQMLGTTRRGQGPRVSSVSWTAARNDDFSGPNPVLNGRLAISTLAVIVEVNTTVEVI